jgi:hypothetical protein
MKQWVLSNQAVCTDTSTPEKRSIHIRHADGREERWQLTRETAEQFVRSWCMVNGHTVVSERDA